MPELPEVETYRRIFERNALDRVITRIEVRDARILSGITPRTLSRTFVAKRFTRARRHGKHFFAESDGGKSLHLHFGMTGDLDTTPASSPEPRFAKVIFTFGEERLAFLDARLFGFCSIAPSLESFVATNGLGIDALDPRLDAPHFARIVGERRGALKAVLMSQEVVAGLGNLYVDELLFATGVHPAAKANELSAKKLREMHGAMVEILQRVIAIHDRGADYPPEYLISNREENGRCPRCGGKLARETLFGRTTFYCRKHQRPKC